jgi:hypothetical protein
MWSSAANGKGLAGSGSTIDFGLTSELVEESLRDGPSALLAL